MNAPASSYCAACGEYMPPHAPHMCSNWPPKPIGIQRKRTKGWRMPPNTVSVTRPGPYGNPYRVGRDGTAQECVEKYRRAWEAALECAAMPPRAPPMPFGKPVYLGPLRGKNLACFCGLDQPCHRNVLLELANK